MALLQRFETARNKTWPSPSPAKNRFQVFQGSRRTVNAFNASLAQENTALLDRVRSSRFLSRAELFQKQLQRQLDCIDEIPKIAERLGYDPEAIPTTNVLTGAKNLVRWLYVFSLRPERVIPSADGGVAATFVSNNCGRAYIQLLNGGEISVVFYSTAGFISATPLKSVDDPQIVLDIVRKIRAHLGDRTLASTAS